MSVTTSEARAAGAPAADRRVLDDLRAQAEAAPPGTRLPSVRALARKHGASPVTVQRALTRLAGEGVVAPHPGRGTFVARQPAGPDLAPDLGWQSVALGVRSVDPGGLDALLALPGDGAIPLSTGFPDVSLQPLAVLATATARAARRAGAWDRMPVEGLEELRAWFARDAGGGLSAHDVIVTPGGQAALATTFRALTRPGQPIVVEAPTYLGALAAARSARLELVPVATDEHGVRPELLDTALERSGAKLAYLQPTYANPTGAVLSAERRAAVLEIAAARDAFLVEDEYARDLSLEGEPPATLTAADLHGHVVWVRSLTKSIAPGLRVAAVAARGAAGARLKAARVVDDFFVSGLLQHTALELVSAPAWRTHRRLVRAELRDRRDTLVAAVREQLPDAQLTLVPTGGLTLWVRLSSREDDLALARAAEAAGVIVSPGTPWFPAESPAPHMRLTYAGAPSALLTEGIGRLAKARTRIRPDP